MKAACYSPCKPFYTPNTKPSSMSPSEPVKTTHYEKHCTHNIINFHSSTILTVRTCSQKL